MPAIELAGILSSTNSIVVLYVDDEAQLLEYETVAKAAGLNTSRINDEGLTQCPPGSITCLGIGPTTNKVGRAMFRKLKLIN